MAAERYSFSIHGKTKYNNSPQTFFILWFSSDQAARDFATWCETYILPNYQRLAVSKLIRPAGNAELPSANQQLTDLYTAKILLGTSSAADKRTNASIPIKPEASISDLTAKLVDPATGLVFSDGTAINRVVSYNLVGRNVVAGGPVQPMPGNVQSTMPI